MRTFRYGLGLFLTLLSAASMLAAADSPSSAKYRPQLAPPFAAGETFSYTAKVQFTSTYRIIAQRKDTPAKGPAVINQKLVEDIREDFSARLVSDIALAREVFKNGSLREAVFLVKSCQLYNADGKNVVLVQPGAILAARKQDDGQIALAINGQTPDPDLAERLALLIPMGDPRDTSNELFGPPGPVAVDDEWPINEKALLNSDLASLFPGVKSVAGGMKLDEVKGGPDGHPRAIVSGRYSLGGVTPPLPSEVNAGPSDVNFNVSVAAPVDPGPGLYDVEVKSVVQHRGKNGDVMHGLSETDVVFGISFDQDASYKIDPAVAASATLVNAPAVPLLPKLAIAPGVSSAHWARPPMPKTTAPNNGATTPAKTGIPPASTTPTRRPLLQPPPSLTAPNLVPSPTSPSSQNSAPTPGSDSPFGGAQDLPPQPKSSPSTP